MAYKAFVKRHKQDDPLRNFEKEIALKRGESLKEISTEIRKYVEDLLRAVLSDREISHENSKITVGSLLKSLEKSEQANISDYEIKLLDSVRVHLNPSAHSGDYKYHSEDLMLTLQIIRRLRSKLLPLFPTVPKAEATEIKVLQEAFCQESSFSKKDVAGTGKKKVKAFNNLLGDGLLAKIGNTSKYKLTDKGFDRLYSMLGAAELYGYVLSGVKKQVKFFSPGNLEKVRGEIIGAGSDLEKSVKTLAKGHLSDVKKQVSKEAKGVKTKIDLLNKNIPKTSAKLKKNFDSSVDSLKKKVFGELATVQSTVAVASSHPSGLEGVG